MSVSSRESSVQRRGLSLNRRELIALGAAAGFARTLAGPAALFAAPAPALLPMSVGFLESSELLPVPRAAAWQNTKFERVVVPARALPIGDMELANESVRLTVHGLYPNLNRPAMGGVRHAMLEVHYPSPDPARPQTLPFYAWGFTLEPGVSKGQRVSFDVPLGVDGGLDLRLEVEPTQSPLGAPGKRLRYETRFTVDPSASQPKMQRGIYFLALGRDTWSQTTELPGAGGGPRPDLLSLVVSVAAIAS